ncbi:PREDICTED: probable polyamine oxidase 5 [Ipomoea nil]|uniref:probable polyamine oxidase 5 n=1 Tax=Ipomoea nil TaxID=35883 RepID=UPI0009015936|nr:PREDICTED: probable polyamine oxidase 5 [Ipomoea nil]XP_019192410.1 PREDICTED: probable polyamine oxidase 5 [Ipomoea nil]XP_019192411.1 PREDICTED: probable polyamine oxidase 5 [Ipomoea nil]
MQAKKPKVVIIGAGMAGLTAANKLYRGAGSRGVIEVCVVEGGKRIGGRINTSEFGGDRIEMGATWIHGIGGSPVHRIAQEINSLESEQPWECMDGFLEEPVTMAEGGYPLNSSLVSPISNLFKKLMDFAQGGSCSSNGCSSRDSGGTGSLSVGSFLRKGLDEYWESMKEREEVEGFGGFWCRKSLEEAIFAMFENTQRTYTSAGELQTLDYGAESEYRMFPGEEITIAKGYLSIIEALASVLPPGLIQLGRKVVRIEWHSLSSSAENGNNNGAIRPVKLHFMDGSMMEADHVILTVSLGVLKQGIKQESCLFDPPLPSFKNEAISRLGFGVVNKLFLQIHPSINLPHLQMVFHQAKHHHSSRIPWWMRRTASLCPIYTKSSVALSWFAGKEALELESLDDQQIIHGVSTTISNFLPHQICNGHTQPEFVKVLKTQWGTDPLFLGSYSYVAVGSSGDDLDTMAEPLPVNKGTHYHGNSSPSSSSSPPLQILFAGEATHRTHYSTTHGAYFSGLREANRLLQHYHCTEL